MEMNKYQALASRTINKDLDDNEMMYHALHGMVGEIGEIHSMYQKLYQGHLIEEEHLKKEVGDLLWFVAEFVTAHGWSLNAIANMNINKLMERYPAGFEAERSLHRKDGDI